MLLEHQHQLGALLEKTKEELEVNEEFSLKEIEWIELKKALLGGYYLELKAKGKKCTIYTDAAQHIYNLLSQNR